ncbi:MAG: glucose-1-phosphate adenylyltransferase [Nitrospinae bacterium]|nr:glucose-1-phosphate adenylyltransferase [Nitrospinota bacterium]
MEVLGMIMAGGEGSRLFPLTKERAKPAVYFGGKFRLIDFVLSNFVNSQVYSIYVLTQFKSQSLADHLQDGWRFGSILRDHFISLVPAQQRMGRDWYMGTADAIYQNINLIENHHPDMVAIFGADHVYRMDLRQMVDFHKSKNADATVAAIQVKREEASSFGILSVDDDSRIMDFQEKPASPKPIPSNPDIALASMGNYIFSTDFLLRKLLEDAQSETNHDFGKDIIPSSCKDSRIYAYDFQTNAIPGASEEERGYWRDVGTIKAFWEANMDLRNVKPQFNLYNRKWPIKTASYSSPPAKFVFNEDGRRGQAINAIVSEGSIISGGKVQDSIIGRNVFLHSGSAVINSIIMEEVEIGRNCRINLAIIDKGVRVPEGTAIGYNIEEDRKKFFIDEESGIVVIPKGYKFPGQ